MLVTWLTGTPNNEIYELQTKLDLLYETLESLEQKEKVKLEEAAKEFENYGRENNKNWALGIFKRKVMHEVAAQHFRDCQLLVHERLILVEGEVITLKIDEALEGGDSVTQKRKQVFTCFRLFLLILTCFLSFQLITLHY